MESDTSLNPTSTYVKSIGNIESIKSSFFFFFKFRSIRNIQKITETIILQTKYSFDASSLDNKRDELLSDGNFLTEIKSERRNSITSSSLNRLERRNSGSWSSTNYSSNANLNTVYSSDVSSITKNTYTFRSAIIVLINDLLMCLTY